jgi:hypothetical protein
MTKAIIICCDFADSILLPRLEENLRLIYPDAELFVAPCAKNPPDTSLSCTSALRWNTGFISPDILQAMYSTDADYVAKIDADTWHVAPYLFEKTNALSGIQWAQNPHNVLGIGYTLSRSAIIELMASEPCKRCDSTKEDQVISWIARKAFPNDIFMHPVGTARKASTYDNQSDCCVVHLGCDADRSTRVEFQEILLAITTSRLTKNA